MKKLSRAGIVAILLVGLIACNPIKFITKKVEQIMVKADPEILEVHGNEVAYALKGKFPPKVFHRKALVTLTPVIEYNGKELKLESINYKGEKAEGAGATIKFKEGGGFSLSGTFPYEADMAGHQASMRLDIKVCKSGSDDCTTLKKEDLAKGFITTSQLIADDDKVFFAGYGPKSNGAEDPKSIGNISRKFERTIFFEINRWNVRTSEQKSDRVQELIKFVKTPRLELKGISVNSYASPDGELRLNQNLTDKRSESTYKFLQNELKSLKTKIDMSGLTKRQAMEEDWAGLKRYVTSSSLADKNEALQIINSNKSNDDKEAELRELDSWETMVEDIMPKLRRSDVSLNGVIKNRNLESLSKMADKDSMKAFNSKELLLYASQVDDLDKKEKAYKQFVTLRPNSIIGYNNLAAIYIKQGNLDKAKSQLDLAKAKAGDNDSLYNNYGVIYRRQGKLDDAVKAYDQAAKAGINVGYNRAVVQTINGDYNAAVANITDKSCGQNVSLIYLLSGNLEKAADQNACGNATAHTYYIRAIAYARKKDLDNLASNLSQAVKFDENFATKATNDLEFLSYWDSEEFKTAVNR